MRISSTIISFAFLNLPCNLFYIGKKAAHINASSTIV
jgi:hypothetical protein